MGKPPGPGKLLGGVNGGDYRPRLPRVFSGSDSKQREVGKRVTFYCRRGRHGPLGPRELARRADYPMVRPFGGLKKKRFLCALKRFVGRGTFK